MCCGYELCVLERCIFTWVAVLPALFCITQYSCCCWLSCRFLQVLVTVCLVPVFLTLYLLTWKIWWAPNNAYSAFKGLKMCLRSGVGLFAARVVSVVLQFETTLATNNPRQDLRHIFKNTGSRQTVTSTRRKWHDNQQQQEYQVIWNGAGNMATQVKIHCSKTHNS
jgi:hypothetical protein